MEVAISPACRGPAAPVDGLAAIWAIYVAVRFFRISATAGILKAIFEDKTVTAALRAILSIVLVKLTAHSFPSVSVQAAALRGFLKKSLALIFTMRPSA